MTASRAGMTLSNGRYHLVEALGDGGMGTVWKAYDELLDRTVAVKELIPDRNAAEQLAVKRDRVRNEAVALAKVEHPVIVIVHDLLYEGRDKNPWIVMAYVRGRSLDRIVEPPVPLDDDQVTGWSRPLDGDRGGERSRPLAEPEAARIGLAVVDGLMACHERGVFHRDVKPANIIQCEDGSVRLVDFGIARIAGSAPLTEGNRIIGTLEFLAPELLQGQPAGPGTDLWSLAVTLYYALEGRTPFRADAQGAIIAGILNRPPPPARAGGALAALVRRMLSKDPRDRPDAAAVAASLRRIASGRPVDADPRPTAAMPQQTRANGSITTGAIPAIPRPTDIGTNARSANISGANTSSPNGSSPNGSRAGGTGAGGTGRTGAASTGHPGLGRPGPARRAGGGTQATRSAHRLTPLGGLPTQDAARIVSDPGNDQAAADLLALPPERAASIVNRCPDAAGGRLLGVIAADQPGVAWKFLHMIPKDRAGQLLDHMNSLAAAAVLAVPPARDKLDVLAKADPLTVVGALAEMDAGRAAALLIALDDERRAAQLLFQTANPVIVAAIVRHVTPAARRDSLRDRLPAEFRDLVLTYLTRAANRAAG